MHSSPIYYECKTQSAQNLILPSDWNLSRRIQRYPKIKIRLVQGKRNLAWDPQRYGWIRFHTPVIMADQNLCWMIFALIMDWRVVVWFEARIQVLNYNNLVGTWSRCLSTGVSGGGGVTVTSEMSLAPGGPPVAPGDPTDPTGAGWEPLEESVILSVRALPST